MAKKPRNLKFADAAKLDDSYRTLPARVKNAAVREVADAFVANMNRIRAMVEFTALALGISDNANDDARRDEARLRQHPAYAPQVSCVVPGTGMTRAVVFQPKADRWMKNPLPIDLRQRAIGDGHQILVGLMKAHPGDIGAGIEAVLSAQIIAAWSAFETLVGDLWETVVANDSKEFNLLKQASKGVAKQKPTSKSDTIDILCCEVSFNGPDGIRCAFGDTRYRNRGPLRLSRPSSFIRALKPHSVEALSAIRNVFAHNAGIIDRRYIMRSKQTKLIPKLARGRQFPLDGIICARRINAAIRVGTVLTLAVDKRLS